MSLAVKVGERSYLLVRSISILRLPNEKMVKFEANKIALNKSFWGLSIDFTANKSGAKIQKKNFVDFDNLMKKFVKLYLHFS